MNGLKKYKWIENKEWVRTQGDQRMRLRNVLAGMGGAEGGNRC